MDAARDQLNPDAVTDSEDKELAQDIGEDRAVYNAPGCCELLLVADSGADGGRTGSLESRRAAHCMHSVIPRPAMIPSISSGNGAACSSSNLRRLPGQGVDDETM